MRPKKKKVVAQGADRADRRGDRKAARAQKRYNRKYEEGGRVTYKSKEEAQKAKLESQIENVKGTPAAKALVDKYRKVYGKRK